MCGEVVRGRCLFAWTCNVKRSAMQRCTVSGINPLAPELFFFLILAHSVYKI